MITICYRNNKGKGYGIRLYSPYRLCWYPFLGPSARKCNGGLGAGHPVLSHTLPVYLPQISPGTHLELGRLWLSLHSHATDPRPKLKNWVHWDSNPRPPRQGIPNPAHQPTRPGYTLYRNNNSFKLLLLLTTHCSTKPPEAKKTTPRSSSIPIYSKTPLFTPS